MLDNIIKSQLVRAIAARALRTFCQGLLAGIGTTALLHEVNWITALSTACMDAQIPP